MAKPGGDPSSGISLGDALILPSAIRHVGGAKLNQALVRNVRTCRSDAIGTPALPPISDVLLSRSNCLSFELRTFHPSVGMVDHPQRVINVARFGKWEHRGSLDIRPERKLLGPRRQQQRH
jgi:hypothetical protein